MGNALIRYLRASPAVYEQAKSQLNSEYGYPNSETRTDSAIPPQSLLPKDAGGRVYLAISAEFCDLVFPSQMLESLIASGAVEEITEAEYRAVLPQIG